ncbi:uncharacterized protein PB18E9.04c-like isoform X2 [Panicum virgatum]|uniref:LisH domain-containing protein n=1 Tax=Panicum virgatum TaxID=38727 RepID=A0A8T0W407_PANVG|nr:uncharacterized protein PB18E9.04c-like isoform X2 [Panicum virgatum]KAG2639343.1 hypothetical protein PVAP13_2KG017600 [Panicum virgatum]
MAPPKPTTPDAATKPKNKKVTAAQVAFLVERYLSDNGFHAALAAFRSDAAHLFSPHRAKPPPKGLLPLADILHDYIAHKEARGAIDSAMHAMHSLVSNYYASSSSSPPPAMMTMMMPPAANTSQPSSPPLVPPLFVASSSSPPQHQPQPQAHASTALLVHNSEMPTKKRKHSKSAGNTTTASKKSKSCTTTSDAKGPKAVASQLANHNLYPTSAQQSAMANLPVQTSSVAKSLFRPPQPQLHSSPSSTPQPSHAMQDQDQPAACTTQRPLPVAASAHTQHDIASQCSIVSSSKTLIVSPLKGGTYYAVERSYHVSSPLKSTTHKSTKREHVKGKLNFDATDSRLGPSEQLICDKASTTSSDEDKQDDFDIDFTNLDIFNGDFSFSELLLDLDLDTEGIHCQNPSTGAEVERLEPVAKSDCVIADPGLPDSVKAVAADSTEDFDLQGATSVTSVRATTKRIKIVSPVKGRTA